MSSLGKQGKEAEDDSAKAAEDEGTKRCEELVGRLLEEFYEEEAKRKK